MKFNVPPHLRQKWEQVPLKRRQYIVLAVAVLFGFLLVWLVIGSGAEPKAPEQPAAAPGKRTGVANVAAPGHVSPLDEWVGNAGRKMAQYEKDKVAQDQINAERAEFEKRVLQRLDNLAKPQPQPEPSSVVQVHPPGQGTPDDGRTMSPSTAPTTSPATGPTQMPPGAPPSPVTGAPPVPVEPQPVVPAIGRVTLSAQAPAGKRGSSASVPGSQASGGSAVGAAKGDTGSFLPVGFARGVLLGGIDAPTGGQAQGNPQPVLIRLEDNAVLPNRYRAQVRECFVVAAGYGDISSERALFRTISLSCVRHDGTALETDVKGSIFGEDGKLGMRGRLVTKQGQMLANALRAGIVGGIGQGFSNNGTTVSTGAYGTITSETGSTSQNMQRGVMQGVGRAMDKLADYYIRLAETTFPIIEIDAGRQVDVVFTKGVDLPTRAPGEAAAAGDDDDAAPARGQP